MNSKVRIAIADRDQLVHDSIGLLSTERSAKFTIVLNAFSYDELVQKIGLIQVDLLVIDISTPITEGIKACHATRKRCPKLHIISFSQLDNCKEIDGLCTNVIDCLIEKKQSIHILNEKISLFQSSKSHLREISLNLNDTKNRVDINLSKLSFSKQDIEIVRLAAEQLTSAEITNKLGLSIKTIEKHRSKLMSMTESKKFIGVVSYMVKKGLL